jgi:hypothetical protein
MVLQYKWSEGEKKNHKYLHNVFNYDNMIQLITEQNDFH